MTNTELKNIGLSELNDADYRNINGGWWPAALGIATVIIYLYNNAADFDEGFREGYAAAK